MRTFRLQSHCKCVCSGVRVNYQITAKRKCCHAASVAVSLRDIQTHLSAHVIRLDGRIFEYWEMPKAPWQHITRSRQANQQFCFGAESQHNQCIARLV